MSGLSRRDLLRAGVVAAAGTAFLEQGSPAHAEIGDPKDTWRGLTVGVASYSLSAQPLDTAIKMIQRVNLKYVSIKDAHLSLNSTTDQRKEVAQKFKDAGITPISCGNVGMRNDEAAVRNAFEYARDLGLQDIVCAPTMDTLPLLDKFVKEFDIRIAIHNHGPGDKFPTPKDVWDAVQPFDKRVGLCIDVGHTARAGADPAADVLNYHERLYDMHMKDVTRLAPNGGATEVGRGAMNIRAIVEAALKVKYSHQIAFEYEKNMSDPLPGLAESVGYLHGLLHGIIPA